ncbi:MAG: glycosyltransferase, partial [Flavobacteriaceae bacterium]|nr:glycosyltransferase [Flavobacteriaceae bacterium]
MKKKTNKKKILIAPLNWGLGHATRCIPIINALLKEGFEPILAGDGDSLKLLQKEFSELKSYLLPSYNIQYTKKGENLKYKLLFDVPQIIKAVKKEQELVNKIIEKEGVTGLISDNRFGVYSKKIPSVYITHQINVLSGFSTFLTSKIHQRIISKFDECWIPDYESKPNLAGKLSDSKSVKLPLKYISPISRFVNEISSFEGMTNNKKHDLLILLSGPEPQRSLLEEKLLEELKSYSKKVLFIRGIISDKEKV